MAIQVPSDLEHQPVAMVTLPYVQGIYESIRRLLFNLDIRVRCYPQSTLRRLLIRTKDPIPPDSRKGVVYSIPCMGCSQSYIRRLEEH